MPSGIRPRRVSRLGQATGDWLRGASNSMVQNFTAVNGVATQSGSALSIVADRERRRASIVEVLRITSAEQDGENFRWEYKGKIQVNTTGGYGGWTDHPSDGHEYDVYNMNEDQNSSAGTYGNGVDQADLDSINDSDGGTDGTVELQPIPTGTRVAALFVRVPEIANPQYWIINLPNGVTGNCPI